MGGGMVAGLSSGYVQGQQQAQERLLQKNYLDLAQKKFKLEDQNAQLEQAKIKLFINKMSTDETFRANYLRDNAPEFYKQMYPNGYTPTIGGQMTPTPQGLVPRTDNSTPMPSIQQPKAPANQSTSSQSIPMGQEDMDESSLSAMTPVASPQNNSVSTSPGGLQLTDFGKQRVALEGVEALGKPTLVDTIHGKMALETGQIIPGTKPKRITDQDAIRVSKELFNKDPDELTQSETTKLDARLKKDKIEIGQSTRAILGDIRIQPVIDDKGNLTFASPNQINKNPGKFTPAVEGAKAMGKTALMEDIRGNLQLTRQSLQNMPEFTPTQAAQIAMAMKGGGGALQAFMNSAIGQALNPAQIDYITNLAQTRENAMAMRAVLGAGQGSQDLRDATNAMIPGAQTPTKAYALKQLDKFEMTLNRLERGVPKVALPPEKQMPSQQAPPDLGQSLSLDDALAKYGIGKKKK